MNFCDKNISNFPPTQLNKADNKMTHIIIRKQIVAETKDSPKKCSTLVSTWSFDPIYMTIVLEGATNSLRNEQVANTRLYFNILVKNLHFSIIKSSRNAVIIL